MTRDEEKILKVAKEVVVKFIEIGRVSPTQFDGVFQSVFRAIKSSVSFNESEEFWFLLAPGNDCRRCGN